MKNLSILLLSATTCLALSCHHTMERTPRKEIGGWNLVESGKLKIPIDSISPNTTYGINDLIQSGDATLLSMVDQQNNNLNFYDIDSKQLVKRVHFESEGPSGIGKLVTADVYNMDSILITASHIHKLYLTDTSAKIKQTFDISAMGLPKERFLHFHFNGKPILINGILLSDLPLRVNYKEFKYILTDLPFFKYDLSSNTSWMIKSIHFPNLYLKPNDAWAKFQWEPSYCRFKDKLALSFPLLDSIYVYDPKSETLAAHGVPDVEGFVFPNSPKKGELKYWFDAVKEGYLNFMLYYDHFNDVFYRIVLLPENKKKENNNYIDFYFAMAAEPIVIQVIDAKDFKLKAEVKLAAEKYYYRDIFFTKDGLFISNNNTANPENDENFLSYTHFKLIK